jgi:uncharacterized membrane protein YkvA (DUF1232 family)
MPAPTLTEASFWDKLITCVKRAGGELLELALQLYYALQAPNTPAWAKAVIVAALGYFISPVDVIPDVLPVIGYTDDLAVLVAAVATVATYITDEIKAKATAQVRRWFD